MGILDALLSSDPRTSRIRQGILQQIGPMAGKRPVAPSFGDLAAGVVAGKRQGEKDYLQEQIMSTKYQILDDGRIAKIDLPTGKVTYEGEAKADYSSSIGELFADRDTLQKQFDSGNITKEVFDRRNSYIDNRISVLNEKRGTNSYSRRRILHRVAENLQNAKDDFARLPKTKDDIGKGTFIPKNVRDVLYTDGKLTGTLKDYMDLIREKPTKPIYRDRVGQTIRGLLGLHIRNRILETGQPSKAKRVQSGAKFSKRIKAVEVGKIKKSGVTTKTRDQQAFDIQQATKAVKKAWTDMSTIEKVSQLKDLSKVLAKYGLGRLLTSTN